MATITRLQEEAMPVIVLDREGVVADMSMTSRMVSPSYIHTPAANTAAVITMPAPGAGRRNIIASVELSYDAAPTGGRATITDGGTTIFDIDIAAAGAASFRFRPPRRFSDNAATVVTLAAGGGAVVGKLNIHAWTI